MAEHAAAYGAAGDHSPLINNYGPPPRRFVRGSGAELSHAGRQVLPHGTGPRREGGVR